ncbi:hypothetical protein PGO_052410 [Plasmodium gonderi]|uniref:Uncharacterized protein n=1 Tax=Plasmodium gonderi TaxID=77519 RepID=A0A1Y1JBB9_PLAGO|nr:hypothetical protein PGO_052410 [Plasmodium gonderi]GAW79831.1 hypothetical protein PGO_052410 [Plasmodium gonderi]
MNEYYKKEKSTREEQNERMSKEQNNKEDNYVFIDEKYKEYFENISDIFEEKVEYILKKHFKKNDPTNKNKLLCLNVCVLWRKRFLFLLSRSLNEYEAYKKKHELKNDAKGNNNDNLMLSEEKKKKFNCEELIDCTGVDENATVVAAAGGGKLCDSENGKGEHDEVRKEKEEKKTQWNEKDLKSFIKNVKIIDNQNIEVIYDSNDMIDDGRPCAELTTDEIYYLLVESKKSENDFKKKIFTFLKYLPLFIRCIENKSLIEKAILEKKLLLKDSHDSQNEVLNPDNVHANMNTKDNISLMEIQNKLDAIVHFNCNLSENLETVFKNGVGIMDMQNGIKFATNEFQSHSGETYTQAENSKQMPNQEEENVDNQECYHQYSTFSNNVDVSKNLIKKNNNSLILPLSKINDLSLINNINTKSNNDKNDENIENEADFYIYKNNMDKLNIYGMDLLINLNNKLIYKINHIYSLIRFYTMLAKDVFNDA